MKKCFILGVGLLALAIMSSCNSNQVSSSSRGPVLGNVPCLEKKYAEDREELKKKMEKKAQSSLHDLGNLQLEAYEKEQQLEKEFKEAMVEEQKRLLGTEVECSVVSNLVDENGNDVFDFFVDNEKATFVARDYGKYVFYGYECELIAQRDFPGRVSSRMFDVFFFSDDLQEYYGSLLQSLSVDGVIKKGDRIPCFFSINNIVTDDCEQLQKKCARLLLSFRMY